MGVCVALRVASQAGDTATAQDLVEQEVDRMESGEIEALDGSF